MTSNRSKFASALRKSVDRIAFLESISRRLVYAGLGQAIGRASGSAVSYWAYRDQIPTQVADLEQLARAIYRRSGWRREDDLIEFLQAAGHADPFHFSEQLFNQALALPGEPDETGSEFQSAFIVGPPIFHPRQFFGRSREVRRVFSVLASLPLQNTALIGPQRSGKTSFLHYLHAITLTPSDQLRPGQQNTYLAHPENYRWVFIDFQDPRMQAPEGLFHSILDQLHVPCPAPCDLNAFMNAASLGITTPTVFLFDEIQAALTAPNLDVRFWWALRSLSTNLTAGRLGFVLAAQKSPFDLLAADSPCSPFLNIFGHMIELGPLNPAEASELAASSPLPFPPEDAAFILRETRGWPALVQAMCAARYRALIEDNDCGSWKAEAFQAIEPFRHLLELP